MCVFGQGFDRCRQTGGLVGLLLPKGRAWVWTANMVSSRSQAGTTTT